MTASREAAFRQDEILEAPLSELIDMAVRTLESGENRERIDNPRPVRLKFGIGRSVYAKAFGFKTMDYFQDPEICLTVQLRWKLFNFHIMRDDTEFNADVGQDFSTAYEPSFFGLDSLFEEGKEPTYGRPVIREPEDLKNLQLPDFASSGLMPKAHETYRALKELCGDRLHVFFPGWSRGPWSIATILRGFNELFLDCVDDPDFVKELMRFIVDSRLSWDKQRLDFLGVDPHDTDDRWMYCVYRRNWNGDLFEDEVDSSLFSPDMNRELVIPYQKQISDFYGGSGYYHSCGNLTPFLEDISTLNIRFIQHISGWTDFGTAARIMPPGVVLQCSLNATDDVLIASESHMRARLEHFIGNALSTGRTIDICPDALYEGGWDTINKVKRMVEIFREIYP